MAELASGTVLAARVGNRHQVTMMDGADLALAKLRIVMPNGADGPRGHWARGRTQGGAASQGPRLRHGAPEGACHRIAHRFEAVRGAVELPPACHRGTLADGARSTRRKLPSEHGCIRVVKPDLHDRHPVRLSVCSHDLLEAEGAANARSAAVANKGNQFLR